MYILLKYIQLNISKKKKKILVMLCQREIEMRFENFPITLKFSSHSDGLIL